MVEGNLEASKSTLFCKIEALGDYVVLWELSICDLNERRKPRILSILPKVYKSKISSNLGILTPYSIPHLICFLGI